MPQEDPNKFSVTDAKRRDVIASRLAKGYSFRATIGQRVQIGRTGVYLRLVPTGSENKLQVVIQKEA